MIDFLYLNKLFLVLIEIFGIYLAFWVYFANRKAKTNQFFSLMILIALTWTILAYFSGALIENLKISLFLARLAYGICVLFFIPFYFFALDFLQEEKNKFSFLRIIIPIVSIVISLFSVFSDFMVKSMVVVDSGAIPNLNYGKFIYFGFVFFALFLIIGYFLKRYFKSFKNEKLKLQYFLTGIFIFVIANLIFNVILPIWQKTSQYYQFGNYSIIFLLVLTAYAIVKQKLFGIKIVLTALLVSFIALLLAFDIFIFTQSHILQFFKGIALVVFLYLGRELIGSVLKEEERVAEIEKMARGLALANQNLRDLLSMKNDFLHIVSHQLRTPLTAMRGFISMWNEGDFDNFSAPKMAEIKKKMLNNAERLNNMVNDMVMAMESEGEFKICLQQVDLRKILANDIEMMKPSFEKKNLYLKYRETAKNIPTVEADEKLLMNVFMNLIDNAEKYTEKGGLTIKVDRDGDDKIKICFADTGIGLSKDDKKILFKKFSRGKKSNYINPNGSGLGLFIIKQIISRHHGKIKAASKGEGKGATFTITLPVRQGG